MTSAWTCRTLAWRARMPRSRFRINFQYSAALTQWTDSELEELFKIWMQVERAASKLQRCFPSTQFQLPTDNGGAPLEHPRVVLIQALTTHIQQTDELREACIRSYRKLCVDCGCSNEREVTRVLASEHRPTLPHCSISPGMRTAPDGGNTTRITDHRKNETGNQLVCPPGAYSQQSVR